MRFILLALVLLFPTAAEAGDGCSFGQSAFHRAVFGVPPPWERCCDAHDRAYRRGGTEAARLRADYNFAACVEMIAPPMAPVMWFAVRIGGARYFGRRS